MNIVPTARRGLTLFEVAISTLVLTVAVLSAMALLPRGIEAERDARSKVFAASIFLTLMDDFHKMQTALGGAQDRAVKDGDPAIKADFVHYLRSYASPDKVYLGEDANDKKMYSNMGTTADDATISRKYAYYPSSSGSGEYVDLVQLLMDGELDPCFGIGIHNANYFANCHSADFEQYLSSRLGGLIPIPPEIARRFRDETGEIQRLLDAGGYLYYIDPNHVRGFADVRRPLYGGGHTQHHAQSPYFQGQIDSAAQRLVIGVIGPAQQNLLPANPWESWPFYEMYPFAPQFMSPEAESSANVYECVLKEQGPVGADEGLAETDLNGVPPKSDDDGYDDVAQNDVHYAKGKYLGVWVEGNGVVDFLDHTAADPDVVRKAAETMIGEECYQGRNWRYFKQLEERFLEADPVVEARELWWRSDLQDLHAAGILDHQEYSRNKWTAGWDAFRLLGGNPNAGWFVAGLTGIAGGKYDYEVEAIEAGEDWLWYHPWMEEFETVDGINPGIPDATLYNHVLNAFGGTPAAYNTTTSAKTSPPWTFIQPPENVGNDTSVPEDHLGAIEWNLKNVTQTLSGDEDIFPTFEMRTTYRDYALRLWDAVRPRPELKPDGDGRAEYVEDLDPFSVPTESRSVEEGVWRHGDAGRNRVSNPAVAELLLVDSPFSLDFNALKELDRIGVPGWRLDGFNVIDPSEVPRFHAGASDRYALDPGVFTGDLEHEFPPHPAQVLALSYLAHAANMVAAWTPPFERGYYNPDTYKNDAAQSDRKVESDGSTYLNTDPDLRLADPITPYWLSYEPDAAPAGDMVERDVKLASQALPIQPGEDRLLLKNNTTHWKELDALLANVPNETAAADVSCPGYINPAVRPGKRATFAQRTMVFNPGDCIALELKVEASEHLEMHDKTLTWVTGEQSGNVFGHLVYEVGPARQPDLDGDGRPEDLDGDGQPDDLYDIPLSRLRSVVVEPQNNNETVADAYVSGRLSDDDPRLRWLHIRRVFLATHDHGYVDLTAESIRDGWSGGPFQRILDWQDPSSWPNELSVRLQQLRLHYLRTVLRWQGNWCINDELLKKGKGQTISYTGKAVRVATPSDIAFARKVHEMCIRWAVAYASENPYDWGAPRPANRPTAWDKPLTMFNIFEAGGSARTPPSDLHSLAGKSTQPFHPWITPVNPQANRYRMRGAHQPATDASYSSAPSHCFRPSHVGPFDRPNLSPSITGPGDVPSTVWDTVFNNHLITGADGQQDSASRQKRFWPLRGFHPRDRCRQVVFWSVPWKEYEDAEQVPSAPVDSEQHAAKYWGGEGSDNSWDGGKRSHHDAVFASPGKDDTWWGTVDQLFYHPELGLMWDDAARSGVLASYRAGDDRSWHSILGVFGADRNFNGTYDRGPIKADNTVEAIEVARFNFYDPIVRLNAEN